MKWKFLSVEYRTARTYLQTTIKVRYIIYAKEVSWWRFKLKPQELTELVGYLKYSKPWRVPILSECSSDITEVVTQSTDLGLQDFDCSP